jgi:diguanylate cyclase (GGDEF)-like protein/PAS domain S-box-containing protein
LAHARHEEILSAIVDAVTVQDRNFHIIYQNPAMLKRFGNCIGSICHTVYEKNPAVCPDCPVAACFVDGATHTVERRVTIDNKIHIFEITAAPLRNGQEEIYAAVEVVRDITSRMQTENRLRRFRNMYAALSHTNKAILESRCREELFDRVCRAVVQLGKFPLAIIGLTDPEGVVRAVAHCGAAASYLDTLVVHADARTEEGRGPTGRAIREGIPYICNDFHNDPITTPWRVAALHHGIRASAAFPLLFQGKVIGALKVYSDHAGFFDGEIVGLVTEMAANISFGLRNFSLEEQRRVAAEALRASEERLKLVQEGSNDGYCDWNIPSNTVWMSARFLEMFGYRPGELESSPHAIKQMVHPDDWPRVDRFIDEEVVARHPAIDIELRMRTKEGEWKWVRYRGKVVERDEQGMTTRVAGACTDISERKMFEEQLRYASTHDQLTGLYNRAYFDAEFERMKGGRNFPVSIVSADLDDLKAVNDRYGHVEGDKLLQLAALTLKQSFRSEDVVARVGGDEFAVLLPNAKEDVVKEAVKRVLAGQGDMSAELQDYRLSISLGTATADNAAELHEALREADSRMYYYKFRRKSARQP